MTAALALSSWIAERIRAQGPISFAQFMEWALYHPELGYYSRQPSPIGHQEGDFFTAPLLGPDFAELLAEQLVEIWRILGQPQPFQVMEMGAGTGILAADLLRYVEAHHAEVWTNLRYGIVERSQARRRQQQEQLRGFERVRWLDWDEIGPDSVTGCFFSNELVDALPVHRVGVEAGRLREIYVAINQAGEFVEVWADPSTPRLQEYFDLVGIRFGDLPEGYRSEVNLAALDWLGQVAARLRRGYLITIDYGHTAERYYSPQRSGGTLLSYHRHTTGADPYRRVGQQDLTAHVDFTALERHGRRVGLETLGFVSQAMFLASLGLLERIGSLGQSSTTDLGTILQRRQGLHLLMDPFGLGNFGVLIQHKSLTEAEQRSGLRGLREKFLS